MKRPFCFLVVLSAAVSLAGAQTNPLYVTTDVPTIPGGAATLLSCTGGPAMLPWEVYFYDPAAAVTYTCALSVPGDPHLDGVHAMDTPGDFLISVEAPSSLGGILLPAGSTALPGDVIHYDSSAGTYTLCFVASTVGIPSSVNVDAIYRAGGDTGPLVVSFDVPTTLGAFPTFEPADLISILPGGPPVICPIFWALAAANPIYDGSTAGAGIAISSNVVGADEAPGAFLLSFDVPTAVAPPAQPTRVPGQVVSFAAGAYTLYETKTGWPITSQDDFSDLANPGLIPATLTMGKTVSPGQLDLTPVIINWSASCSAGGVDYGIYEGTLGTWYSHTSAAIDDCNDAGANLTETVTPAAGNRYYLVVPHNVNVEGSYGTCSPVAACGGGNERPLGGAVCATPQVLTPCPPP